MHKIIPSIKKDEEEGKERLCQLFFYLTVREEMKKI